MFVPILFVFELYLCQDENLGIVHDSVETVGDGDDSTIGELILDSVLKEENVFDIYNPKVQSTKLCT